MLFLGIQFPFFQLMMTLLVVSVFIINVMNTVLNISVVTEADAPRPAAGRPRAEDRTESKPHVDTRRSRCPLSTSAHPNHSITPARRGPNRWPEWGVVRGGETGRFREDGRAERRAQK